MDTPPEPSIEQLRAGAIEQHRANRLIKCLLISVIQTALREVDPDGATGTAVRQASSVLISCGIAAEDELVDAVVG